MMLTIHRLTDKTGHIFEIWGKAVDGTYHLLDSSEEHTFYVPLPDDTTFESYRDYSNWSVDESWQAEN